MGRIPILRQIWALLFLLCLMTPAWSQNEQWLQYHTGRQTQEMFQYNIGSHEIKMTAQQPEGLTLPEGKPDEPLFGQWPSPLAPKGTLGIMLTKNPKTGGYDQLFIDSNGDGRLADEQPVKAFQAQRFDKNYYRAEFGPVRVVLAGEDGPITYHLNFQYRQYRDNKDLSISAAGWYEGPISIEGKEYFCVLADMNANGVFNDKSLDFGECDRIHVGAKNYDDLVHVGNYIFLADKYYQLEVAADGAFVKLTPAMNMRFGAVKVQPQITDFRAGGENGLFKIRLENGVGQLPIGKYRVERWVIDKKDDQGRTWKLTGQWFGEKGDFEIVADKTAEPAVGEPIKSSISEEGKADRHDFKHDLKGRLDERITLTCGGQQPRAPRLAIRSETGDYEKKFTLEYG
jgi:hypothetical protein